MISTVLFDLDGTLLDSAPDLAAALNEQLQKHQRPPVPYRLLRPHASSGARGMLRGGFDVGPESPEYHALKLEFLEIYERNLLAHTQFFPRVPDLLLNIERTGRRWGIVTNKAEHLTRPLLKHFELSERSACVVCGDTTPYSKPHPAPLLEAARRMSVAPIECLYVGDDERDITAARAAGMHSVAARYGYVGATTVPEHWGADGIIDSPMELLKLLSTSPYGGNR